jgi:NAD+ kinase
MFPSDDIKQVITLKKIGILYHPRVKATGVKAGELESLVKSRGITVWTCSSWDNERAEALLDGTDLLLTVGGDGTLLRAAQIAMSRHIPISGINLGTLGFMSELDADEALEKLPALLGEKGWIDERSMLQVEVKTGDAPTVYHALNDIVVARGEIARLIRISVNVDGQHLAVYKTDGLILATATGSTGYNLAAGGPIMYPRSRDFLMVPISPHLSMDKPLVLPEQAQVELILDTYHAATLSVDGHINLPLSGGDTLVVKHSPNTTRFWRISPPDSFYNILEEKLRGKTG